MAYRTSTGTSLDLSSQELELELELELEPTDSKSAYWSNIMALVGRESWYHSLVICSLS